MSLDVRPAVVPAAPGGWMARLFAGLLATVATLPLARAETRAWLDRASTTEGEAVTLNIETDQRGVAPDYRPLHGDFVLGPPYRSAAPSGDRTLFGVALTPRRTGTLAIPALQVGAERTAPQRLEVAPAQASVPRGDVFLESRVDVPTPAVQQSVGLTVRLYYATPLLSGELTQEAPDGASLQRIGDDVQSSRQVGSRRYQVVERRYLLVPERSGRLELPPARFRGQGAGGFFDDFFGTDRNLAAQGPAVVLDVRAQPDGAPQPWLPLRGLRLRYVAAPAQARSGEAVEIVVEAVAQGATAAQFPEIPVPQVDGAQVFAERAETTERFVDGGPQLTAVRRYSVVPLRAGELRVPGPRMDWWDAQAGRAQVAALPDLRLQVEAGAVPPNAVAAPPAPVPAPAGGTLAVDPPGAGATGRGCAWLAAAFALLWLLTLGALLFRSRGGRVRPRRDGEAPLPSVRPDPAALRRVLDAGSFEEAVQLLRRMADEPLADLDAVIARLDDPAQAQALEAMRRALWSGEGEPAAARAALRAAFRDGPRWRPAAAVATAPLPPLYPRR
ncbi:protein BatD [Pseudoxanthomonas sp. 10H]|uniref:protein BatD n=1 Tax=Pseudoxanthomonas sp. 10H TaxID=3242729 RepID=UPI003558777D